MSFAAIRIRDTLIRIDAIDVVQPLGADRAKIVLRSGEWVEVWATVDEIADAMQRALSPCGYVRD